MAAPANLYLLDRKLGSLAIALKASVRAIHFALCPACCRRRISHLREVRLFGSAPRPSFEGSYRFPVLHRIDRVAGVRSGYNTRLPFGRARRATSAVCGFAEGSQILGLGRYVLRLR